MKLLSYFFILGLTLSSIFSADNLPAKTEENFSVEAIINTLTEDEKEVLSSGFSALANVLKVNLEKSEEYMKSVELLRSKGLDISFLINLVPVKDFSENFKIEEN